jgi:hypothetical protein
MFARGHLQYFKLRVLERDKQIRPAPARGPAIGNQGLCTDFENLDTVVKADTKGNGGAFRDTGPESFIDID